MTANMLNGIIIKGIGGFYYVKTENGVYECKARGIFRKMHITPTVGDYVSIEAADGKGSITEIKERRNLLARPPVANIDLLVIVMAAASPEPNLFLADKILVNAEKNNIKPVICINKTDLCERDDIRAIYTKAGYDVIELSAANDDNFEQITNIMSGRVSALAGLSGVGKSTLLGKITAYSPETGSLSEKINRGKHTTRHVELMELSGGGYVFDTPGFGAFELTDIRMEELYRYFPEMACHEGKCRFKGCSHIKEPDCEIRRLAECGEISAERYKSYCLLYNELKSLKKF